MFIDASALVAMLASEEDAPELFRRLENTTTRLTSPLAIWEASVALARNQARSVKAVEQEVYEFLSLMKIEMIPIPASSAGLALDAFERYGKGHHKAGLNFGDCFAYACASLLGVPLLYKGADFALTDIESA